MVVFFLMYRLLEAFVGPDEVAKALVILCLLTQQLELYIDDLEELVERTGWILMKCGEECSDV